MDFKHFTNMRAIETILVQLDKMQDIQATRREIYLLLRQAVESWRQSPDHWRAFHLANAIRALALNVNSLAQPSLDWLRLCLSDFRLACFPPSPRRHAIESGVMDGVTMFPDYKQLNDALDELAPKIGMNPGHLAGRSLPVAQRSPMPSSAR